MENSAESSQDRLDYLKAKYLFRYPFTFKAIKWGATIGLFLSIHSFIRFRLIKKSFETFVWGSLFSSFPIWAFFMAKYNFYEASIDQYEKEEYAKHKQLDLFKLLIEQKLKLPKNHDLSEDEMMKKYEEYSKRTFYRNSQLDELLVGINKTTFD